MAALKIGLNTPKRGGSSSSKPAPAKRKPIFGEEENDDEDDSNGDVDDTFPLHGPKPMRRPFSTSTQKDGDVKEITTFDDDSPPSNTSSSKSALPSAAGLSKPAFKPKLSSHQNSHTSPNLSTLRSQTQQTADVDPSLYDYDAAYDALHSVSSRSNGASSSAAAKTASEQGHMNDLLAAAELRKRDQLRAKERLLQKEREAEGEEFKDKDTFVTEAYKAQQEEVKKAEELEKQREEKENERRRQGLGMSNFYKGFMEEEERKHQQLVEAAATSSTKETKDDDIPGLENATPKEKSDLERARELKTQGRDVDINEEGQVLDKRELLTAGLNVAPKPRSHNTSTHTQSSDAMRPDRSQTFDRGRTDARRATRERQSRMMEEQLEQAAKRAAEDEAADREKLERAAKSRKTDGDISSAKERYLQRKRDAAEAAARAKQ